MSRFYLDSPLPIGHEVTFPDPLAHHAIKVLRLKQADTVELWNGDGQFRIAHLNIHNTKNSALVSAKIISLGEKSPLNPLHITLIQALPESDKMDWIIEKACEVGVDCIVPIQAQRSVVRLHQERQQKRLQHWQRIVISACSQCGRAEQPALYSPQSLQNFLENTTTEPNALKLWLHPKTNAPIFNQKIALWYKNHPNQELKTIRPQLFIAIGPEGGWSPEETQIATTYNFQLTGLGPRVLRTETAGLFASAQALALTSSTEFSSPKKIEANH